MKLEFSSSPTPSACQNFLRFLFCLIAFTQLSCSDKGELTVIQLATEVAELRQRIGGYIGDTEIAAQCGKVKPLIGREAREIRMGELSEIPVLDIPVSGGGLLLPGMTLRVDPLDGSVEGGFRNPFQVKPGSYAEEPGTIMQAVFESGSTSHSEAAAFSLQMSAKFKSFVQLSADYEKRSSTASSEQKVYFGFVQKSSPVSFTPIDGVHLKSNEMLAIGGETFTERFVGTFGTHYISSVRYGVLYLIEAEVNESDTKKFGEFKSKLNAAIAGIGVSASVRDALTSLSKEFQASYRSKLFCAPTKSSIKDANGLTVDPNSGQFSATNPSQIEEAIGWLRSPSTKLAPVPLSFTLGTFQNVRRENGSKVEAFRAMYRVPADSVTNSVTDVGIGTVIASLFPHEMVAQYEQATSAHWIPADGRIVPSSSRYYAWRKMIRSKFGDAWDGEWLEVPGSEDVLRVPDLRGQFLRGVNEFAQDGLGHGGAVRVDGEQDPDGAGRVAGSWQADAVGTHHHFRDQRSEKGENKKGWSMDVASGKNGMGSDGPPSGRVSSETRPKNIGVYYYIRIN